MKRLALIGLAIVASFGTSNASVPMTAPSVVAPIALDRAAWTAKIAGARVSSPATFARVAKLRADVPRLDEKKRGPLAVLQPGLENLGPDATAALVSELLAIEPTWTKTAARAWRAAILEALASHPDARDAIAAFLDDADPVVARAAATAIARLGDDAALLPRIATKQVSAIEGAGSCRKASIARALASVVASRPTNDVARATARSLGFLGSTWAHAPADVREIASRALIELFVGYSGEVRDAAANALLMVDDPTTPALIAAAKVSASSDTIAALDRFALRFAKNAAR
jgi:hypothetical protein